MRSFFLLVTLLLASISPITANLSLSRIYPLKFTEVNGNTLLTSDGHVTIVVLTTPSNLLKAQMVGDPAPSYCIGNPTYRVVTVVKFGGHSRPVRAILTSGAGHRLNAEAKRVQPRYDAKKITRDPRRDIFAVADFDGTTVSQLDVPKSATFRAFVFGRRGELVGQWNDVPNAENLAAALR